MDYLKSTSKVILDTVTACSERLSAQSGVVATSQLESTSSSSSVAAANQPRSSRASSLLPSKPAANCLCQPRIHDTYAECFEQTVYTALISAHYPSQLPTIPSGSTIPRLPSVSDVVFLGAGENPVSRIIIKMLRRPGFKDLVNTVAAFLLVYWVLRVRPPFTPYLTSSTDTKDQYRFFPSPETLSDIPEWLRPTEIQDTTPHQIWTDFIQFPALRNAMVQEAFPIVRDDFDMDYSAAISCNWPPWQPLLVRAQGSTFDVRLNSDFVAHVTLFSSWSLGVDFARKYPEMAGLVTIRP
ncbi:hypothetical protein BJX65DRAFT_312185 [Aspergillus insuetus]